jgi:hypothetical protein
MLELVNVLQIFFDHVKQFGVSVETVPIHN